MMNKKSNPDPELAALLDDLWQRHLPSTRDRLKRLDDAVRAAVAGVLDEAMRSEAQSVAHKLSGNLGMFGYMEAGDVASEIEHIFKNFAPGTITNLTTSMAQLRMLLAAHL